MSLSFFNRRAEVYPEIRAVLATTVDPVLRKDALFIETSFRLMEPIDESAALSLAEAFIREAPGDNRAAGFLHMAAKRFEPGWITRLSIIGIFVLAGVLTLIGVRRHFARRLPVSQARGPSCWTGTPCERGLRFAYSECCRPTRSLALVGSLNDKLTDTPMRQRLIFIATMLLYQVWHDLHAIATSGRMVGGPGARGRDRSRPWCRWLTLSPDDHALAVSGPVGDCRLLWILAVSPPCDLDGRLVTRRRDAPLERMVREYPDSFWGRLVQGERRQQDRLGETFELEFTDAITGRPVSMKDLRGKVVVVDFWATWCGPCVAEIPEMKRLYDQYHDKGVAFFGVSQDVPAEDGGLEALEEFVAKSRSPGLSFTRAMTAGVIVTGIADRRFLGVLGDQRHPHRVHR